MIPPRIPDHVGQGLGLAISQYRGRPIFAAWTASYLAQVQELEDAIYGVILRRCVDRATGEALDFIGRLVGEERLGRTDDVYRLFVTARIRINRSHGRVRDLLEVYTSVCSAPVRIFDRPAPATMGVEVGAAPPFDPAYLLAMLRQAKAAGYGLTMVVATAPAANVFLPGPYPAATTASTQGAGSYSDPTTGGRASSFYA